MQDADDALRLEAAVDADRAMDVVGDDSDQQRHSPRRPRRPPRVYSKRMAVTLFTIGHSTRGIDELLGLLAEHGIETLIDVRRFPASRRHPQFSREALAASLAAAGIAYVHEPDLGGRRQPQPGSPNTAWRGAPLPGSAPPTGPGPV